MSSSLCILIIGVEDEPGNVLRAVKAWEDSRHTYLAKTSPEAQRSRLFIARDRLADIFVANLGMTNDPADIEAEKPEWRHCINYCRARDVDFAVIPEAERLSSSLTQAIAFSLFMLHAYDLVLLTCSDGLGSMVLPAEGERLVELASAFEKNLRLGAMFEAHRNYAVLRTEYVSHWGMTGFMGRGWTCRYANPKSMFRSLFRKDTRFWDISTKKDITRDAKRHALKEIYTSFLQDEKARTCVVTVGKSAFRLEERHPDDYSFQDMLWMLELDWSLIPGMEIASFSA